VQRYIAEEIALSLNDEGPRSQPSYHTPPERRLETTGNTLRELSGLPDAPVARDSDDLTGSVFGRFRILSVLGKGGMGIVYLAEDAALAREVALKVLALDLAEDPEHRQRLLREARASAALSHPNIAAIHEMGEVDGRLYIAMEKITGESLRRRIDKGRLEVTDAVNLAKQILAGVAKAHEAGIVHRDIKPDNIMVTTEGQVKVLDFGIAKFLAERRGPAEPGVNTTEHGRLLGTPSYMSPEQANAAPIDARSDVFSCGIVIYEMIAGKTPFSGKHFLDVLAALARDEPRPITEFNPQVSKDLEAFITRCLSKDPDKRYENAGEALAALATCSISEKTEPTRPVSPPRSNSTKNVALFAAIVMLIGGAIWWTRKPQSSPELPAATPSPSAAPSASSSATVVATTIMGHPPPKSDNEAALAAYREGLQALRDGAYIVAHTAFSRAVELDSTLGAAYVRLVITSIWHAPSPEDVRRAYRKAISYRDNLAERDKLLLAALEPIVLHEPPDTETAARRLREASERFPGDAELFATRSLQPFAPNMSPADELALSNQCLALDPSYADCLQQRASSLFRLGHVDDALAETERCLEVSPGANDCIADRMEMRALFGRCEEMAEDARHIIANDPNDWNTHRALATALLAQGRAPATVRAALDRAWDKAPTGPRERWMRFDNIHFALLEGRFADAEQALLEWKPKEDKNPFDYVHRALAEDLVELYEILGKPKEAAKIADEYLNTREVWIKGFVRSIWDDPTMRFLKKKLDAGMISAATYQSERATWVKLWENRLAPDMRNIVWFQAYVVPAETVEDAREALALQPTLKPLEYYRKRPTTLRSVLGNAYTLVGRFQDALPHLTAAAKDCRALYQPLENTRTHYRLARAQEGAGDNAGACASYGVVLQRWGNARPKPPLVDETRKHFQKLACKAPE